MPRTRRPFAQVALPVGLRRLFTYRIPPALKDAVQLGHRVRVPFGRRSTHGYVVAFTREEPPAKLRSIAALDPEEVLLTPEILRLTEWVAQYYLSPWGQVLEAALPASVRRSPIRRRRGQATSAQAEALEDLAASAEPDASGASAASADPTLHVLQPDQVKATSVIRQALGAGRYAAFLLFGVTGSGKTEVYLDAAERVVDAGGNVLFLVPEIAMGTQILSRVMRRFAGRAGLYHSQTGDAERRRVWNEARAGRLPVVVGTRSAVFVPLPKLRLVVVDEEHEPAYKQDEAPRYYGRDVAVMRARMAGAVAVLGSATPSLESLHNVERGKYELLTLPERIDQRPAARVTLIDLNEGLAAEADRRGAKPSGPRPVLSPSLLRSVQERLDRGEQTILFLNRRGHSTIVQCSACGEAVQCRQCDIVLTFHKPEGVLRCHYCNSVRRNPDQCESCGGNRFFYTGAGTQKVEEMLQEACPAARIARLDLDAVRQRGAHGRVISAMERGEIDILLGTQMVAKGFHFPRVTLVGVLQADREMFQPDFRASERAFQVLTQVAGRSGRGAIGGEVVFQSYQPTHPVIAAAVAGDYAAFAEREMEHRRAFGYPPCSRMIDLLVDGRDPDLVRQRAEALREELARRFPGSVSPPNEEQLKSRARAIEILGPAPMPHAKLMGRHRWHLTLKGRSVEKLHQAVLIVLETRTPRGLSGTRIQVDVDPLGLF